MASFVDLKNKRLLIIIVQVVVVPVIVSASFLYYYSAAAVAVAAEKMTISTTTFAATAAKESSQVNITIFEKFGVKIERNPPESKLTLLNVTSWPKWGCEPSKFPWTFTTTETMFLLEGKVKVYCDGHDEFFEIGAGDLVEFPKGMKITWDVTEAVNKHYSLKE